MEIDVWDCGDRSIGINPNRMSVTIEGWRYPEDTSEREGLRNLFKEVAIKLDFIHWGSSPHVQFGDECWLCGTKTDGQKLRGMCPACVKMEEEAMKDAR